MFSIQYLGTVFQIEVKSLIFVEALIKLITERHLICRYMGTITGISDLDPVRWKNSQWRNLQVDTMVFSVS